MFRVPAVLVLGCALGAAFPCAAALAAPTPAAMLAQSTTAAPAKPATPAPAKAAPAEAAPATPATPSAPTPPKLPPASAPAQTNVPSQRPECMWLGQRIVSLLYRDDVNTAREQVRFYDRFGCPGDHLKEAFRCVIRQSEKQPQQTDINARIYGCWMSPEIGEPKAK